VITVDERSSAPRTHDVPAASRLVVSAGAVAVCAATFVFRFLTVEFVNDHFQHLARGRQILLGELPIRDFFDPGLFLQYYASAAALLWSGQNLYGEALLTVSFIAAGAGLTFFVAARLSKSLWLGTLAAALAVASLPRLYNYPKVFFYIAALAVAWWYARQPARESLVALCGVTVLAFLFRHDHGVYIAISAVVLLLVLHWGRPNAAINALTTYVGVSLLFVLPFLVYVQATDGLVRYVTDISPQIRHVSTPRLNALPVTYRRGAPLLTIDPPAERRINIRWAESPTDTVRHARERLYGLSRPVHVEGRTWSYVPTNASHANIGALVADPAVEDTSGIDRGQAELDIEEPLYLTVERWIPLFRMHLAPGLFTPSNALAWFYYVTVLIPVAGFLTLAVLLWKGRIDRPEAAVAAMAVVLCFVIVQTLVRGSPDSRLPDVASPIFALAAWVTARVLGRHGAVRRWRFAIAATLWTLTAWSVTADAHTWQVLDASRILTGPAGIAWKWQVETERLQTRPIDTWRPTDPGVPALGRYVFACTRDTDRVLVTWFAPEIFFYAERAFAGGQVYLQPRWHASVPDQQLTVARMSHERVPLVLVRTDHDNRGYFPLVDDYIRAHYREALPTTSYIEGYRVFVDTRLMPTGTYGVLGLPCYR
jgi:hypothetical protein